MIDQQSVLHLPGVPVLDVDGDIMGSVERVYVHEDTGAPLWVSIQGPFDGDSNALAPLDGARFDDQPGSALHVGLSRAVIEGAPRISSVDTLTTADVHSLRGYYSGVTPTTPTATLDTGSPRADDFDDVDVDLVRSEEQFRVGTVSVPKERVRFEKVIVSEERTVTVTVRREELRIVREPIGEGAPWNAVAGSVSAADRDFVLREERVIVTTEIVPVERVRVSVAQVIEDLPVTAALRKERVDITTTAP